LQALLPAVYKRGIVYDVAIADPTTNVFTYYYDVTNGDPYRQPLSMGICLKSMAFPTSANMGEETGFTLVYDSSNITKIAVATLPEATLLAAINTGRAFLRAYVSYTTTSFAQTVPSTIFPAPNI
jgi:hypothetical protein